MISVYPNDIIGCKANNNANVSPLSETSIVNCRLANELSIEKTSLSNASQIPSSIVSSGLNNNKNNNHNKHHYKPVHIQPHHDSNYTDQEKNAFHSNNEYIQSSDRSNKLITNFTSTNKRKSINDNNLHENESRTSSQLIDSNNQAGQRRLSSTGQKQATVLRLSQDARYQFGSQEQEQKHQQKNQQEHLQQQHQQPQPIYQAKEVEEKEGELEFEEEYEDEFEYQEEEEEEDEVDEEDEGEESEDLDSGESNYHNREKQLNYHHNQYQEHSDNFDINSEMNKKQQQQVKNNNNNQQQRNNDDELQGEIQRPRIVTTYQSELGNNLTPRTSTKHNYNMKSISSENDGTYHKGHPNTYTNLQQQQQHPNQDHRKQNHCEIEKRRRDKMNHYIMELASIIPAFNDNQAKFDKLTVLRMAVQHVRSLRSSLCSFSSFHLRPSFLSSGNLLKNLILQMASQESQDNLFMVVSCDRGKVLFVSESSKDILNQNQNELVGQYLFDMLHKDDVTRVKEQISYFNFLPREMLVDSKTFQPIKNGQPRQTQSQLENKFSSTPQPGARRSFFCRMKSGQQNETNGANLNQSNNEANRNRCDPNTSKNVDNNNDSPDNNDNKNNVGDNETSVISKNKTKKETDSGVSKNNDAKEKPKKQTTNGDNTGASGSGNSGSSCSPPSSPQTSSCAGSPSMSSSASQSPGSGSGNTKNKMNKKKIISGSSSAHKEDNQNSTESGTAEVKSNDGVDEMGLQGTESSTKDDQEEEDEEVDESRGEDDDEIENDDSMTKKQDEQAAEKNTDEIDNGTSMETGKKGVDSSSTTTSLTSPPLSTTSSTSCSLSSSNSNNRKKHCSGLGSDDTTDKSSSTSGSSSYKVQHHHHHSHHHHNHHHHSHPCRRIDIATRKRWRYIVMHCTGYLKCIMLNSDEFDDDEFDSNYDQEQTNLNLSIANQGAGVTGSSSGPASSSSINNNNGNTNGTNSQPSRTIMCLVAVCRRSPMDLSFKSDQPLTFTCRYSMEGKFVFVDQKTTIALGYTPQQLLGTSHYAYCHKNSVNTFKECHRQCILKSEAVSSDIYQFKRANGQYLWLQTSLKSFRNPWTKFIDYIVANHTTAGCPEPSSSSNRFNIVTDGVGAKFNPSSSDIISAETGGCSDQSSSPASSSSISMIDSKKSSSPGSTSNASSYSLDSCASSTSINAILTHIDRIKPGGIKNVFGCRGHTGASASALADNNLNSNYLSPQLNNGNRTNEEQIPAVAVAVAASKPLTIMMNNSKSGSGDDSGAYSETPSCSSLSSRTSTSDSRKKLTTQQQLEQQFKNNQQEHPMTGAQNQDLPVSTDAHPIESSALMQPVDNQTTSQSSTIEYPMDTSQQEQPRQQVYYDPTKIPHQAQQQRSQNLAQSPKKKQQPQQPQRDANNSNYNRPRLISLDSSISSRSEQELSSISETNTNIQSHYEVAALPQVDSRSFQSIPNRDNSARKYQETSVNSRWKNSSSTSGCSLASSSSATSSSSLSSQSNSMLIRSPRQQQQQFHTQHQMRMYQSQQMSNQYGSSTSTNDLNSRPISYNVPPIQPQHSSYNTHDMSKTKSVTPNWDHRTEMSNTQTASSLYAPDGSGRASVTTSRKGSNDALNVVPCMQPIQSNTTQHQPPSTSSNRSHLNSQDNNQGHGRTTKQGYGLMHDHMGNLMRVTDTGVYDNEVNRQVQQNNYARVEVQPMQMSTNSLEYTHSNMSVDIQHQTNLIRESETMNRNQSMTQQYQSMTYSDHHVKHHHQQQQHQYSQDNQIHHQIMDQPYRSMPTNHHSQQHQHHNQQHSHQQQYSQNSQQSHNSVVVQQCQHCIGSDSTSNNQAHLMQQHQHQAQQQHQHYHQHQQNQQNQQHIVMPMGHNNHQNHHDLNNINLTNLAVDGDLDEDQLLEYLADYGADSQQMYAPTNQHHNHQQQHQLQGNQLNTGNQAYRHSEDHQNQNQQEQQQQQQHHQTTYTNIYQ